MNITIKNVRDLGAATESEIAGVLSQAHVAFASCEVVFDTTVVQKVETVVKEVESEVKLAWHAVKDMLGLDPDATPHEVVAAVTKAVTPSDPPAPIESPETTPPNPEEPA